MFFITGVTNGEKKLNFDQMEICPVCGQYGHLEVRMTSNNLTLYFIPVFRWGRRYFATMSCCGASAELPPELGKDIDRGNVTRLSMEKIRFHGGRRRSSSGGLICQRCGYEAAGDFAYCPKCGNPL